MLRPERALLLLAALAAAGAGCAIKKLALNSVASALASGGDVFASDDDPQLVREAVPFALKTYESLLAERPRHRALLVATAAGFTQYAYGFVVPDAERLETSDLARGLAVRRRAQRLLLRGRDYGLRALELGYPGIAAELRAGRIDRLAGTTRGDVPALFWTGAAWGAAIGSIKDDPDLLGDLSAAEALMRRVIELDEGFDRGAAHEVMVTLEAGLAGGSLTAARTHFERAVELSAGHRAAPFVAYAENVAVKTQDRALFDRMIGRALKVDPAAEPGRRLANVLAQERAGWLRSRAAELFVE